jgi:hypothetical protein
MSMGGRVAFDWVPERPAGGLLPYQPNHVTLGVREEGKGDPAGDLDSLAAQPVELVERS